MKFKIKNDQLQIDIAGEIPSFPLYSTQIFNLANRNAQGTRPKIVGQMSDLIQEFPGNSHAEWKKWYSEKYPNAIEDATDKIYTMVKNLKKRTRKSIENLSKNGFRILSIPKLSLV